METIGIVKTTYGLVQGVEMAGKYKGITQFRGIPFAKPPVGELRWIFFHPGDTVEMEKFATGGRPWNTQHWETQTFGFRSFAFAST